MESKKKTVYIHFGSDKIDDFRPVQNRRDLGLNKPINGLWASRYTPDKKYRSVWEKWCVTEKYGSVDFSSYFLFTLKQNAKVLRIGSEKGYIKISDRFKDSYGCSLDWEKIQAEYDAFELMKGHNYWSGLEMDSAAYTLCSWDVPSIVVFRLSAIDVIKEE